jgi:DNA-binding transcriptional LysR family regulator
MELRHLRYFVAVAEEGHITRAAERLGIQQPPLSQQIRALEAELDVRLLRRLPRGVELTQAGEAFLVEARDILGRVDEARAAASRAARGEQGRIGIGFTSSASFHPLVPRLIRAFRDAHPLVSLSLEENGTAELVTGLRQATLDVAFVRSPIEAGAAVIVESVLEESMVAALPAGHRLSPSSHAPPLLLAELSAETFILYRRPLGPGLYDAIIAVCQRAGFAPQIGQEAPRMLSTLSLVAAGLGVTLIPASMQRLGVPGIVYRSLDPGSALVAPLNLAYRRGETAPATRRLISLVRSEAQKPSPV